MNKSHFDIKYWIKVCWTIVYLELRVCVLGSADVGKSTLLGVLTQVWDLKGVVHQYLHISLSLSIYIYIYTVYNTVRASPENFITLS